MKWVFLIFVAVYVVALALTVIGTYGLFGSPEGPLAGIFLMPLGLPWNILGDKLNINGPFLLMASPAINAGILYWLWKR